MNTVTTFIRHTLVITRKEIRSYFVSPIAYGLMAFFALIAGYFFYIGTAIFVQRSMESQMMGQGMPMNVNEWVIRPVLSNVSVIGLFLIPMISMRLFAEEKRSGTFELLATSPVRDSEIIIGKWLAALVMWACILAISLIDLSMLFGFGHPDWKPMMVGFLGLLLQGGCLLAIGTFISTLTRSQIVAGVATFAVCLLLWVLDWVTAYGMSTWAKVVAYMSVLEHFDSFAKGVIDTKDVVFYLTMIFLGLFLTARSLESVRWRA
jgi:gliding motility-associated transport system permease protein